MGAEVYTEFFRNIMKEKSEIIGRLTVQEICAAEKLWIQAVQAGLKEKATFSQLVKQLGLVESEGILYLQGKTWSTRPLITSLAPSSEHQYTIKQCHKRVHHSGIGATLTEVRSRYWIPKGRQKVLSKCVVCKKLEGKAFSAPPNPDLSSFRVKMANPFSTIGVDFAGPLFVKKEGNQIEKVYIVLFIDTSSSFRFS